MDEATWRKQVLDLLQTVDDLEVFGCPEGGGHDADDACPWCTTDRDVKELLAAGRAL